MMDSQSTEELILPVSGMTCSGCAANVERAIRKLEGVVNVAVNLRANQAVIEYKPDQVGMAEFSSAVERAGYSVPASQPSTFSSARFKTFKKPHGSA